MIGGIDTHANTEGDRLLQAKRIDADIIKAAGEGLDRGKTDTKSTGEGAAHLIGVKTEGVRLLRKRERQRSENICNSSKKLTS